MTIKLPIFAVLAAVAVLGGCRYAGPSDDPVDRNLSWFDYVGGENVKAACGPGASDRLRFVYNGIYDEQIRSYDVRVLPGNRGVALSAFARGAGDMTRGIEITNLLSPWRGNRVDSVLSLQTFADLRAALREDSFTGAKPVGLRMPSNEFYWVVTGCLDGRFHANAWMYPSDRFKALKFPAILIANDRTGVDFGKAVPVNMRADDPTRHDVDRNVSDETFIIQLDARGIVGARGLF